MLLQRLSRARILQRSGWFTAGTIAANLLQSAAVFAYLRFLAPEDLGALAVVDAVLLVLTPLLLMGLESSVNRFYPEWRRAGVEREKLGLVSGIAMGTTLLVLAALLVAGPAAARVAFASQNLWPNLLLGLVTLPIVVLLRLTRAAARMRGDARAYALLQVGESALRTLLSIGWVMTLDRTAGGVLKGRIVAYVVLLLPLLVYAARTMAPPRRGWTRDGKRLVGFGAPLAGSELVDQGRLFSDRFILERAVTLALLGAYSVGLRLTSLMQILPTSIKNAIVPEIYHHASEPAGGPERDARLRSYFHGYAEIHAPLVLGLALFLPPVVTMISQEGYHAVTPYIGLFLAGAFLANVQAVVGLSLLFTEETRLYAKLVLVQAVAQILLAIALVRFSFVGPLVAQIVLSFLMIAWLDRLAARRGVRFWDPRRLLGVCAGLALAASLASVVAAALDPWVALALFGAVALAATAFLVRKPSALLGTWLHFLGAGEG